MYCPLYPKNSDVTIPGGLDVMLDAEISELREPIRFHPALTATVSLTIGSPIKETDSGLANLSQYPLPIAKVSFCS
jgi:hypothetical protein